MSDTWESLTALQRATTLVREWELCKTSENPLVIFTAAAYAHHALKEAAAEIERLRAERDEARREVCDLKSWNFDRAIKPEDYALLRKWCCFPPAT